VPESLSSSRNTRAEFASPRTPDGSASAELRLAVLWSLPTSHQTYLFEEVRRLCGGYLRRNRISSGDVTPDELVSEVWKKLLSAVALDSVRPLAVRANEWSTDPIPGRDGRVIWLIAEIGGSEAIGHRYEDIQRERLGRSRPDTGRPYQQSTDESVASMDPDQPSELEKSDSHRVWRGLLATAAADFGLDDDVTMLLNLLASDLNILDDSAGGQWPIRLIAARLSDRSISGRWVEDRVDNAKRRLMNWIVRLRTRNQLDGTDLEALFARVGRQLKAGEQKLPSQPVRHDRLN
jgi:hypothetical protein